MVFTGKDGTYSGTDIIRYPFRIIHHELGIQCRFYDLRGNFATICLRNGCEIKDIAEIFLFRSYFERLCIPNTKQKDSYYRNAEIQSHS